MVAFAACTQQAAAPVGPVGKSSPQVSPQGDTWDSIKQLPDFSGAWTQPAENALGKLVFADCCLRGPSRMQLTPAYQAKRNAVVARLEKGGSGEDPLIHCLPDGLPGIMLHGLAFQYLFTPGNITLIIEDGEVRRIHTDGRVHPPMDELHTSPLGHSTGHWEGNTLVVDTVGIRSDAALFFTGGVTIANDTHIVERMWLKDKDTLMIETTIEDPAIFTKPYTYQIDFTRTLREDDFEVGCALGNRDNEGSIDLTPPPA